MSCPTRSGSADPVCLFVEDPGGADPLENWVDCDLSTVCSTNAATAYLVDYSSGNGEWAMWGTCGGTSFCCVINDPSDELEGLGLKGTAQGDTLNFNYSTHLLNAVGRDQQIRMYGLGGDDSLTASDSTSTSPVTTEKIFGNNGNDTIVGRAGVETIEGGNDNDVIYGEAGDDILYGNDGNDRISGGSNSDLIYGGAGNDLICDHTMSNTSGSVCPTNDHASWSCTATALSNNDKMRGDGDDDCIYGSGGDDQLGGGSGLDYLYGGENEDILCDDADGEADELYGQDDSDQLYDANNPTSALLQCDDNSGDDGTLDEAWPSGEADCDTIHSSAPGYCPLSF